MCESICRVFYAHMYIHIIIIDYPDVFIIIDIIKNTINKMEKKETLYTHIRIKL